MRLLFVLLCALACLTCRERDARRASHTDQRASGPSLEATASDAGTVELVAHHASGVPLHPAHGAGDVSARLPGGTRVRIEAHSADGRWLRIRAADGTAGWITRRYAPAARVVPAHASEELADSPWSSPEACRALLGAGRRAARTPATARIGTWNLRWFPDGAPGRAPPEHGGTDIAWLACAIAWLEVDLLALQEIKNHARARERSAELLQALGESTGARWQLRVDDCPNEAGQHVGFLWNEQRVNASTWTTLPSLNPHGIACKDQLRPGLGAYFRFSGGLDVFVVSAHLKSGRERRAYDLRRRSIAGLGVVGSDARQLTSGDPDLLVAGDLNTMGCTHCASRVSAADEAALLAEELAPLGLRLVASTTTCTEYFQGRGALLDHFLVASAVAELPGSRRASVSGFCADRRCGALPDRAMPRAYRELSDHCPVVVELDDRDLD